MLCTLTSAFLHASSYVLFHISYTILLYVDDFEFIISERGYHSIGLE